MTTFRVEDFAEGTGGNARTAEVYRRTLSRIEAGIGKPLAEASLRDLNEVKRELRAKRSGPYVANILRMFYRAAYRATDDGRYMKMHEALKLRQRVKRLSPDDILSLGDVNAMVRAANSLRDRALVVALWETGVRIHELLSVDLKDVRQGDVPGDGGRTLYAIFFRKVKVAGEEHTGYVVDGTDHLRAWLDAHPDRRPDAPLFTSWRETRLGYTGARDLIVTIAKRAGIAKRVFPHLFRHSRATYLLQRRVPEAQVKKLLGWTPGSPMLARYSHLTTKDARDALLRANGIDVPEERVDVGGIVSTEADLKAVVPMAPGIPNRSVAERERERAAKVEREHADIVRELVDTIVRNPEALERLRRAFAELPSA